MPQSITSIASPPTKSTALTYHAQIQTMPARKTGRLPIHGLLPLIVVPSSSSILLPASSPCPSPQHKRRRRLPAGPEVIPVTRTLGPNSDGEAQLQATQAIRTERKWKSRDKTPIQQRKAQRSAPSFIITQNQMPRQQHKNTINSIQGNIDTRAQFQPR